MWGRVGQFCPTFAPRHKIAKSLRPGPLPAVFVVSTWLAAGLVARFIRSSALGHNERVIQEAHMGTTGAHFEASHPSGVVPIDELASTQGVGPVESLDDLAADVWATDAELDAFLADVRHSRLTDIA